MPTVERALVEVFGEPDARASVTFLGVDPIEVLRFVCPPEPRETAPGAANGPEGPDAGPLVRYVTLGMSAEPMNDPAAPVADPVRGPRAELVLTLRPGTAPDRPPIDRVLRPLAVLAAAPRVEGVVPVPGASLDTGEPLWPGAPFTAVLVGEPGGLVPDVPLPPPADPVRILPLLPMTPNEAAWKRVHGAEALRELWLSRGTDTRDPRRAGAPLPG
ncbi:suppressor of fused domain protein [Streptomyces alkaliphilus]|uniref:Suppressor of fused domain protein n=1 Tax=Streptomyces alkaliphilus TaxID=1472722 RepID=A0A7W3Y2B9_9ACTN|nr:suppressor of fused domain protein [Streptomyces alkaliphilus]MBB0245383.1 suppressor of fused domain protein [Streptomyces alkaliphilus]